MRKEVVPAVAIAMTIPAILSARSDDIPTLDVQPVCRGIASQSADPGEEGLPDSSFAQCVKSEQEVREQLKKVWSTFSAADKQHCVTLAKTGGESSYTELLTCLEMARDVRTNRAAAATPQTADTAGNQSVKSGRATTRTPSSRSQSSLYLSTRSPSSPSPSSASTSMVQPAPPTDESSMTMVKELQQAKVDAINARASESMTQRKLADTEADLKQAKDVAAQAAKEAQQAKTDAQAARQSSEADLKQAKAEAARATKEAQQAKTDAQAARQSQAEAERKLVEKQSQADPLGTWLRGLGAWLRGLVS
jgi:hypothetical protein